MTRRYGLIIHREDVYTETRLQNPDYRDKNPGKSQRCEYYFQSPVTPVDAPAYNKAGHRHEELEP